MHVLHVEARPDLAVVQKKDQGTADYCRTDVLESARPLEGVIGDQDLQGHHLAGVVGKADPSPLHGQGPGGGFHAGLPRHRRRGGDQHGQYD